MRSLAGLDARHVGEAELADKACGPSSEPARRCLQQLSLNAASEYRHVARSARCRVGGLAQRAAGVEGEALKRLGAGW